ncbi:MAG: type V CRISPR-associated endonuclease Cas1 [Bacilli bacterium]
MLSKNDFIEKQVIYVMANSGEKVSFKNDNIVIKNSEDKIIHQSTCYRLFAVYLVGNVSITSGIIERAKKFDFSIVMLNSSFKVYQILNNMKEGNTLLKRKQYEYSSLDIAKHIIKNKTTNQLSLLKSQRYKSDELIYTIDNLAGDIKNIMTMGDLIELISQEGRIAKKYFKYYFMGLDWNGRKPRLKLDMINACLDIGYTILFQFIESILCLYGFDLYVGVLHTQFYMRKSLVCDIIEPFRVIIDKTTRDSINLGVFSESDFKVEHMTYNIEWKNYSKYVSTYLKEIMLNKKDIFLYVQRYYRCFMKGELIELYPEFDYGA